MPVGIVALSFAKREQEPNPVNVRLAQITDKLYQSALQESDEPPIVVIQWEVALAMTSPKNLVVTQADATNKARNGELYLDTQDVLNKAFELFISAGVTRVAVVANRFIHKQATESIVKKAGFAIYPYKTRSVGFDNDRLNLQWWCKGPIRFITYLGIQVIGKVTGQNFHGIGEKTRAK